MQHKITQIGSKARKSRSISGDLYVLLRGWNSEVEWAEQLMQGQKTNLDSVLKSRDITLPKKACIVKAMVFPVVKYECESWTTKKGRAPKN